MDEHERFLARLREAFERAAQRSLVQHALRVVGRRVHLLIAGEGMLVLLPALTHLIAPEVGDGDDALTICLWDSASTGVRPPPPPWDRSQYGRRGEIAAINTTELRFAFDLGSSMLYAWSAAQKMAICWCNDAHDLPAYERGAPLLPIWHWWLGAIGDVLLHTAAVSNGGMGALIVGRGGSGKSTTALACLGAGMGYLGDDYCAVTLGKAMRIHSLFCTAKLRRDGLHRLPYLGQTSRLSEEEKVIFDLRAEFGASLVQSCELKAILLPAFAGQAGSSIEATSPGPVMHALAPSTLFQLAGSSAADFQRIADLVKRTPCYRLWLGEDASSIPDVLKGLLREATLES